MSHHRQRAPPHWLSCAVRGVLLANSERHKPPCNDLYERFNQLYFSHPHTVRQLLPSSHTLPASLTDAAGHPHPHQWLPDLCETSSGWQSRSLVSPPSPGELPLGGTDPPMFCSPPRTPISLALLQVFSPFLQHFQTLSSSVLRTAKTNSSWDLFSCLYSAVQIQAKRQAMLFCRQQNQFPKSFLHLVQEPYWYSHSLLLSGPSLYKRSLVVLYFVILPYTCMHNKSSLCKKTRYPCQTDKQLDKQGKLWGKLMWQRPRAASRRLSPGKREERRECYMKALGGYSNGNWTRQNVAPSVFGSKQKLIVLSAGSRQQWFLTNRTEVILDTSDIKYSLCTKINNLKHSEELYLYQRDGAKVCTPGDRDQHICWGIQPCASGQVNTRTVFILQQLAW